MKTLPRPEQSDGDSPVVPPFIKSQTETSDLSLVNGTAFIRIFMCRCVCDQWMTVWLTDPHFSADEKQVN